MPRVPAPLRPQAAPRRPLVLYPVRVPRPRRVPDARAPVPPRPAPPGAAYRTTSAGQPPAVPAGRTVRRGPQIQLIPASADGALDAADEAVDLLLDSGRAPGDVLVLTTGEQHPWAAHELSFGEASYWAQHDAGDDVFYADAAAAERAAARPVVVVAVNGGADDAAARALPTAHGQGRRAADRVRRPGADQHRARRGRLSRTARPPYGPSVGPVGSPAPRELPAARSVGSRSTRPLSGLQRAGVPSAAPPPVRSGAGSASRARRRPELDRARRGAGPTAARPSPSTCQPSRVSVMYAPQRSPCSVQASRSPHIQAPSSSVQRSSPSRQ